MTSNRFNFCGLFANAIGSVLFHKRLHHAVENAVHVGQGHAVVANRNALIDKEICAVEQLLPRAHAAATLDGEGVFFGVGDGGEARHILETDVFSREIQYHTRQFHPPDVVAGAMVGA